VWSLEKLFQATTKHCKTSQLFAVFTAKYADVVGAFGHYGRGRGFDHHLLLLLLIIIIRDNIYMS
jgi:hypothetical protein